MGTSELGLLVCKITVNGRPVELSKLNPNDRVYRRLIQVLTNKFMSMSFNDYYVADINDEEEIQRAPPFVTSDQIRAFMEQKQPRAGSSHILVYRSTGEMDTPEYAVEVPDTLKFVDDVLGDVRITFSEFIRIKAPKAAAAAGADPNRPVGAGAGPAGPAGPALPPVAPVPVAPAAAPLSKEEEDAARYKQDVEMAGGRKKRRHSRTKKHSRHSKKRGTRRS